MKKGKLVLIGPVYPYKGGISHYTSLMYQALAKTYDVEMISFKMQYPRFLFKKKQKDYRNDMFRVKDTQFLIHTANPFNILQVGRKIKAMKPSCVIIQWWHPYFAPCYWILENVLGRKIKKLFICHNVFPHERFPLDRFLTRLVLKKGDAFIVHSRSDGRDLCSIKENPQYRWNVHPTYNAFKIKNMTKEQAREELKKPQDAKLLLFFGFVRKYKGLKYLLQAMQDVKKKLDDVELMIVGSFDQDKEEYLRMISVGKLEQCVQIVDQYMPDNEVEKYFAGCDLVVLPYESATQSGIVQIAYGFEKPVIATEVGGLPDVVIDGATGYVTPPKDSKALADSIIRFFEENKSEAFRETIRAEAYKYSWDKMVESMEEIMS